MPFELAARAGSEGPNVACLYPVQPVHVPTGEHRLDRARSRKQTSHLEGILF